MKSAYFDHYKLCILDDHLFTHVALVYIYQLLLYPMGLHCKKKNWGGEGNEKNKPAQTQFCIIEYLLL